MKQWIHEKVVQRYFKENADRYTVEIDGTEQKIDDARFNESFDRFPDVYCEVSGTTIPVEVEWTTNHFDHHDHEDFDQFVEAGGVVAVFERTGSLDGVDQIELDRDDFNQWVLESVDDLVDETLDHVTPSPQTRLDESEKWEDHPEAPEGVPAKAYEVVKEIDGREYIYWQWRTKDGNVTSQYGRPANPA